MTRFALLGDGVETARSRLERTRGLLGTAKLPRGGGLWIVPCRSIHSFGMRYEFDALFIDGIVNGAADLVRAAGDRVRRLQGGVVGGYAFSLLAGAVLLVGYILYRNVVQ